MAERLQKILSSAGVASRRAAEELISAGRVSVNGLVANLGMSADAETDEICVDGKAIPTPKGNKVYIMLNKPRGYVTTVSDELDRPTVMALVEGVGRRVYPVGRLDMYSEGLLIFTDDGEAANALMHPKHNVERCYAVDVHGEVLLTEAAKCIEAQREVDGKSILPAKVKIIRDGGMRGRLLVTIHEGRNREVRRLCSQAGLRVSRLRRVAEGELELGELPTGKWRYLTAEEVRYIKSL